MAALAPIACLRASGFLSAVAVKAPQKDNLGLIGLSISLALLAFRRVTDITSCAEMSSLLGFFLLLWISQIVKLLALDNTIPPLDWKVTYRTLFDFRGIGTENQQVEISHDNPDINVTVSSGKQESRITTSSSKNSQHRIFLLKRLTSAVIILLLNHCYTTTYSLLLHLSYADFHSSKQSYLRSLRIVTARETAIRGWLVLHFVWSSWASLTATHDLLAFAHVAVGIDEPED
ncbi:MAG: hypothetical protein ALECFALPRED_011038 [Alectoria fallacina]|uniref:Uncharacterized protein n=1 Tax=Alectoria fallacina TaxID=1903189 RepID=A0A8H3F2P9_9LECA|nr:MAG: hypothetical protein ALECFALPRED_011038 [Alectoria fallacina]